LLLFGLLKILENLDCKLQLRNIANTQEPGKRLTSDCAVDIGRDDSEEFPIGPIKCGAAAHSLDRNSVDEVC
jgi:hypothetical protein